MANTKEVGQQYNPRWRRALNVLLGTNEVPAPHIPEVPQNAIVFSEESKKELKKAGWTVVRLEGKSLASLAGKDFELSYLANFNRKLALDEVTLTTPGLSAEVAVRLDQPIPDESRNKRWGEQQEVINKANEDLGLDDVTVTIPPNLPTALEIAIRMQKDERKNILKGVYTRVGDGTDLLGIFHPGKKVELYRGFPVNADVSDVMEKRSDIGTLLLAVPSVAIAR